jgi:hypothetical protein
MVATKPVEFEDDAAEHDLSQTCYADSVNLVDWLADEASPKTARLTLSADLKGQLQAKAKRTGHSVTQYARLLLMQGLREGREADADK